MKPLSRTDPTHVASYRLLGVLGEGGMGRVYLGQSRSGRKIAVKVLSPQIAENAEYRARFAREVAAARAVNPLFTAAVVDAGPDDEVPWLATAFINGPSLQEWVRARGPLAEQTVLTLAAGLAEALASIHRAGLVHRDLKPSNVLIDERGPHIIDFGIALNASVTRITTSLLVGTPSYMAPERVHGADASPAGDVFSLGATLFFAGTGEELIRGGTFYEQISQVALGRFDLSKLPPAIRSIAVRCLSPQASDRPTAEELSQILAGMDVFAPGPGWVNAAGGPPPPKRVSSDDLASAGATRRKVILGSAFGVMLIGVAAVAAPRVLSQKPPPQLPTSEESPAPIRSAPPRSRVLWHTTADASRPGAAARADAAVAQILVEREGLILSARGSVLVATRRGQQIWTASLPTGNVELRQWQQGVLASDLRRLWLVDSATGSVVFDFDAGQLIDRVAVGTDRMFLNAGNATICLDRAGNVLWRLTRSLAPLTADATYVVAREPEDVTTRLSLRRVANGTSLWSVREDRAPATNQPPPGPPRPGEPPRDDAHDRAEARLGNGLVVLRNGQEILARQLSGGRLAWHTRWPTPVAAMELTGDVMVVSADRLSAHQVSTGQQIWDLPIRGARIALTPDRATIIAATSERVTVVSALDGAKVRWQMPNPLPNAMPDRITTDERAAYIVYRPREESLDQRGLDVVAIDLT